MHPQARPREWEEPNPSPNPNPLIPTLTLTRHGRASGRSARYVCCSPWPPSRYSRRHGSTCFVSQTPHRPMRWAPRGASCRPTPNPSPTPDPQP
eukprot:scaffold131914_cov60-Phaeocystis_antarctica.AAC.1